MVPTASQLFSRLPRVFRRHRLMKAWMQLTGEDALQLVRIREDAYGYADMSDGFLRLIVIDGDFESDFFHVADHFLEGGGVFVDVGANHGLLSLGLAHKYRQAVSFHLFEPNEGLRGTIERSLRTYPPLTIKLNGEALASSEGNVRMHFETGHLGMSHVVQTGGVTVDSITLDAYLLREAVSFVDLIKIDVEGFELEVLRGAEKALDSATIGAIYFEYCEKWLRRNYDPAELLNYLEAHGYVVCFCRAEDLASQSQSVLVLRNANNGELGVLPIAGLRLPETTDLLAVPRSLLETAPLVRR
jgi:FkbM family methyltransferase